MFLDISLSTYIKGTVWKFIIQLGWVINLPAVPYNLKTEVFSPGMKYDKEMDENVHKISQNGLSHFQDMTQGNNVNDWSERRTRRAEDWTD
jgi:hypothetical protein